MSETVIAGRHSVPTHLDTADGVGNFTTRQLLMTVGSGLIIGPTMAGLMPPFGPSVGELLISQLSEQIPTISNYVQSDMAQLSGFIGWAIPTSIATVLALPLDPPVEHGAISWMKYRTGKRLLGPKDVSELLGEPSVERNVATAFGKKIAIWDMPSISMRLASDAARSVERARWAAFLDGLPCPIQTIVRAVPVDLKSVLKAMADNENPNGARVSNFLGASTVSGGEIERRRLLVVRGDDTEQLERFAQDIDDALARATLRANRLEGDDLADVLHHAWTSKPRRGKRIGPQTIRVEADGLNIDGEWLSTVALQRWPTTVAMDFLASFYDGSYSIDVVETIKKLDHDAVRRQLEDRLSRFETTTETRKRKLAMTQLNTTLDALEQHTDEIFEVEIYFTVRAYDRKKLTNRRRQVLQVAREIGGEAKHLRWEHIEGALASAGTLETRLINRAHKVDTSSVSRAYPWGASELAFAGAVPWGKTLYGNRRVSWTPFNRQHIPNPNVAVYGGSGAGKGFSTKVWTSRAVLAKVLKECFVVDQAEEDPEGEYGRWARYLKGEVRKLHKETWEQDLVSALADIPHGTLPPAIVLNIAELSKFERCRAMVDFKRAVFARAAALQAQRGFILDEMWSFADDKEAEGESEDLVRRGRHVHLNSWFMTQRPMDALDSSLGKTVQSICATQWYGMQNPSEISDVSNRLRWNPEQIRVIERFGRGDAMLVAGMHRVAFHVDYSTEEYDAFHTDYTTSEKGGTEHGRSNPDSRNPEPAGRPVAGSSASSNPDSALEPPQNRPIVEQAA